MGNESVHKSRNVANLVKKEPNKSNKRKKLAMNPLASLIVHNGRQFPPANIVQRKGNHLNGLSPDIISWLSKSGTLNKSVVEYAKIPIGDTNYFEHYQRLEYIEFKVEQIYKTRLDFLRLLYLEMKFVRDQIRDLYNERSETVDDLNKSDDLKRYEEFLENNVPKEEKNCCNIV
jgi:hypothetical protein